MIIKKILNHNAVVGIDQNKEVIIRGKGIAFQKTDGDEVDEGKIEKIYTLSSSDMQYKFQELMERIPISFFKLTDDIIAYAKQTSTKKFNDSIYIALSDHIYTSIERSMSGVHIKNVMLWDIRRFYKDEFHIGLKALEMIEKDCGIQLPEDEAGFIALHIVNAQLDEELPVVYDITKVMQEISNIVKYTTNVIFDEDSVYYYRFITHLKFFAQRLFSGKSYENEQDDILDTIKVRYQDGYGCVMKIKEFLLEQYHYDLSNEEQLYLTIHIQKIVQECRS